MLQAVRRREQCIGYEGRPDPTLHVLLELVAKRCEQYSEYVDR
jgi:hypothetical protein